MNEKIKKLKELIENKVKNLEENEEIWLSSRWETFLKKELPDFESIIKDPRNFQEIDEMIDKMTEKHRPYYCEAFINVAGPELANHWFYSDIENKREISREWLSRISTNLTPSIWNKFTEPVKEYLINHIFERFPGEPWETYRKILEKLDYFFHKLEMHCRSSQRVPLSVSFFLLPPPVLRGYIPSSEIRDLLSVIKNAGDKKYFKIVNDRIKERKEMWEKSVPFLFQNLRIPYTPSKGERELIALIMNEFMNNGYKSATLPQIYLSFEIPPLFVSNPEIEEIHPEKEKYPENISIEELLGVYVPSPYLTGSFVSESKIILYQIGIEWLAKFIKTHPQIEYQERVEYLRSVVLLHEIGHWIAHLLPEKINGKHSVWSFELYQQADEEVHEGWAQFITWLVVHKKGGVIKDIFEEMNKFQSGPYRMFERLKNYPADPVIRSLSTIRKMPKVTFDEWEKIIKIL